MTGGKIGIEIDEAVWGALQGYTMPMESVYYLSCASDGGVRRPGVLPQRPMAAALRAGARMRTQARGRPLFFLRDP